MKLGCPLEDSLAQMTRLAIVLTMVQRRLHKLVLLLSGADVCRLWRWLLVIRTSSGLLGRTQRSANMILVAGRPDILCLPLT